MAVERQGPESSTSDPAIRPRVHVSVVSGADETLIVACIESVIRTTRQSPYDLRFTAVVNKPGSNLAAQLREREAARGGDSLRLRNLLEELVPGYPEQRVDVDGDRVTKAKVESSVRKA